MSDIASLLVRWRQDGDRTALDEMLPVVYDELRRLARIYLSQERPDHTLQPTELVHEAFMRLAQQREVDWRNRAQFLGVTACIMRRILLQHARDRVAQKREGFANRVALDLALESVEHDTTVDVISLNDAMERLEGIDPRLSKLVELRVFGGLTIEESSEVLEVSPATIKREWTAARIWLRRELS